MHEYSIVVSLVDRVEREAFMRPGAIVRKLHVRIGELAGVEPDLLQIAYKTFRLNTRCEDAELAIDRMPVVWHCPACKRELAGPPSRCPTCQCGAQIAQGEEIILERIEMEVPDV